METRGVEIIRRAVPAALCASVRDAVLVEARRRSTPLRRVADLLGFDRSVRSPWNRTHVALPLTSDVETALKAAARALANADVFKRAGLGGAADLVELSAMVADPGAAEQKAHTDVAPETGGRTCTLWIALQDVDAIHGPTAVWTHPPSTVAAYDWGALKAPKMTTYEPDGSEDPDAPPPKPHPFAAGEPKVLTAGVGDVFLMDCRTFHRGTANTSRVPRAQLSATFQIGVDGDSGFTYQLRDDVPRLTLADILGEGT